MTTLAEQKNNKKMQGHREVITCHSCAHYLRNNIPEKCKIGDFIVKKPLGSTCDNPKRR